jgi:hypothetical protein
MWPYTKNFKLKARRPIKVAFELHTIYPMYNILSYKLHGVLRIVSGIN